MSNIWVTSDTHAYHRNMARGVSIWADKDNRNFKDQFEMTKHLIDQINKYVKHDDILYHCGDWSLGDVRQIKEFRHALNIQTIHLMLGNHDKTIRNRKELHKLFTSVQDRRRDNINGQYFIFDHYSLRSWHGSPRGVIMLYGHSHGNLPDYGKSMDVGIDNAFKLVGEYRPFNLQEIIDIMDKKDIVVNDHHK